MSLIASLAHSVLNVTSITLNPPSLRAWAKGIAFPMFSMATTGIIPAVSIFSKCIRFHLTQMLTQMLLVYKCYFEKSHLLWAIID